MERRIERVDDIVMTYQNLKLKSVAYAYLYHPGVLPSIGAYRKTCGVQGFQLELVRRLL